MNKTIEIVIDCKTIEKYNEYYFALHPKAKKNPILHPYHESINTWMIMKRPMMNDLKQRWKDFIVWVVKMYNLENIHIEKCEIAQRVFYQTNRRHDIDNTVPKFIIDGLVESGMIVDDDSEHITKLTLECFVDKNNPRTEIIIKITEKKEK